MPITNKLDSSWYKTQNIHLCTITDFISLCNELHINIEQTVTLRSKKHKSFSGKPSSIENLLSEEAIFLLEG
jgi:hypothetical protein